MAVLLMSAVMGRGDIPRRDASDVDFRADAWTTGIEWRLCRVGRLHALHLAMKCTDPVADQTYRRDEMAMDQILAPGEKDVVWRRPGLKTPV
jgi:hypothetical protein